jgi:KUP system potassium uptake protein
VTQGEERHRSEATGPSTATATHRAPRSGRELAILCVTALGVVYGDIGTSPLYALRECFHPSHGILAGRENVLGVLSLIFWSLVIVVTLKYTVYVLRLDNRGEGGILALMGLVRTDPQATPRLRWVLVTLGVFGAALLYGDGIITPAISVLSAVEGLEVATPIFGPYVVPITIAILVGLFLFQKRGTTGVGAIFGPIMLIWFLSLAGLGIVHIAREPGVLGAVNPVHAINFFARNGVNGFLVLGAVFLVATGSEALYADMGHFGKRPLQIDWFGLVGISLLLNYFGQGALVLQDAETVRNPFYLMAPGWALYPMVILATMATVIASQAMISAAFSLTRQAVQLGYLPRVDIEHTSAKEIGQIYIPGINWALMAATIGVVLGFRSSSNLAAAYGIAVTLTMIITTILAGVVSRHVFGWSIALAVTVTGGFLLVDLAFFGANMVKVAQGGWFPLVVAAAVFSLMTTWRRGRRILNDRLAVDVLPVDLFLESIAKNPPTRVPGTAVFMSRTSDGIPVALLHNLKHNKVLHKRVVFLTVETEEIPHVSSRKRVSIQTLSDGFYRIILRYGFMQDPDVPGDLGRVKEPGLECPPGDTTYFLGKETVIATKDRGMALWREKLFGVMTRNARNAAFFFRLPPNRVVELGAQIEL